MTWVGADIVDEVGTHVEGLTRQRYPADRECLARPEARCSLQQERRGELILIDVSKLSPTEE